MDKASSGADLLLRRGAGDADVAGFPNYADHPVLPVYGLLRAKRNKTDFSLRILHAELKGFLA